MLKFLIADDHPLFREALIGALRNDFSGVQFLQSDSFNSSLSCIRKHRSISLVLLDLNMPGCENFYGLLRIRQSYPELKIIVVSASDDAQTVSQVMEFGANGFIPKTLASSEMVSAINAVLKGDKYLPTSLHDEIANISAESLKISQQVRLLTPKQFQVLRLVKQGLSNKDIADTLNVTEATIKAHISSLFKRLKVKSRTQILVALEKLNLE